MESTAFTDKTKLLSFLVTGLMTCKDFLQYQEAYIRIYRGDQVTLEI